MRVVVLYTCPSFGKEKRRKWIRYQREREKRNLVNKDCLMKMRLVVLVQHSTSFLWQIKVNKRKWNNYRRETEKKEYWQPVRWLVSARAYQPANIIFLS